MFKQAGGEFGHLFFEGDAVVFHVLGAHVATGGEDVAVALDLCQGGGFPPAGFVLVVAVLVAPVVVDAGDGLDVCGGEFAVDAVDQAAQAAGVDEQGFAAAVAQAAFGVGLFGAGDEPEADGDLGGVEELARQGDHAVDHVLVDHRLADGALTAGAGGHGAVGHDKAGDAVRGQVVDEVLNPGVVGVVGRRGAVFPAHVVAQPVAAPVGHVERRVGEDVVGLQVLVQVVVEAVGMMGAEVGVNAPDGQVHLGQFPGGGVGFLAVDGDVAQTAATGFHEALGLHEHAAGAAAGVEHPALVGLDHLHQQLHHALGGVELAAAFALGGGELAQEIFIHPAQRVLHPGLARLQVDIAHGLDQLAQAGLVQRRAGVVLGQHAPERGVLPLQRHHGLVDGLADGGLGRLGLDLVPAGLLRHPEDVGGGVFVAVFRVGVFGVPGGFQFVVLPLEGIGDVLEEDQPEHHMLVFARIHVAAHLVGHDPEFVFEAEVGPVGGFFGHLVSGGI